ncbi:MAG: zf-TFIIB domain-containing protein, partial [Pirellulales bacterium]|nr:zf-TFIIB domain-containing protein [Pirellulales bacterium]
MRLLIACPQCHRQFDAGARPIGSRFRCHCGSVVTVRRPHGHNATVVRCSSCGAPRQQGSMACSHCGSDFTLHERDLDTICPECFARISNRAKFCHHCGLVLRPEALAGEKTELTCPICGKMSRLSSRQVGDVALMECGCCAGFWLGANILEHLVKK